jgi:putative transposase
MTSEWFMATEIADLLSITKQGVISRASREQWTYRTKKWRGGPHKEYLLTALPADVQAAYAASVGKDIREFEGELKPVSMPEKKVALTNHNARSNGGAEVIPLEKTSEKRRRTAQARAKLIRVWDASGWNAERFVADLREQLGGKSICQATLYNWLAKYQTYDEAGLVPQYKARGGYGAGLDERTKGLIWAYYLHKNKPSVAHIIRTLDLKEGIRLKPGVVYNYVRYEIPDGVKDYFRRGRKYYHDHYESYIKIDYERYHSMEMVVYDHKTLDFASRVLRGDGWHRVRLVLTAILDKRSRMLLGWWIDEIPSTLTIIRATRMMVERYGCPESGQFDNGKDFTSYWFTGDAWNEQHNVRLGKRERDAVSCVTDDLGMAAHFTWAYHGQSKHIERAFGFFAQEFDKSFESYLGSNTCDRADESHVYLGSFDGAPARPIEELPSVEETRELFGKFAG